MLLNRVALIVVAVIPSAAQAEVLYVDDDAPLGGDGSSWGTAYRFLQDALASASAGDEIRVAQGTYKPDQDEGGSVTPGDRYATFELVDGAAVKGGYAGLGAQNPGGRDIVLYETRLTGDLDDNDPPSGPSGQNSFHVLTADPTVGSMLLDGVTVASGEGPSRGGGLIALGATITVVDSTFRNNRAGFVGGGVSCWQANVEFVDCSFHDNLAHQGGAFDNNESTILASGCTFSGNSVTGPGGAIYSYDEYAGPVSHLSIDGCTFMDNHAQAGGAVFVHDPFQDGSGAYELANCIFLANAAAGSGGALAATGGGDFLVVNCVFAANTAANNAGAVSMAAHAMELSLSNCTLYNNEAVAGYGGGLSNGSSATSVSNCVLWGNAAGMGGDQINWFYVPVEVRFSCIEGGWPEGVGNIDADPLFVDPDNGDYRLSPGSPCIDAGDNTALPDGIDTDLDGNPRFVDDPDTVDTGYGDPPLVDMGAYEYQGLSCPWDLDGDGNVFVTDLLLLIASFGPCEDCPADFDGDGFVNVVDLLALIANFGPCPGVPCVWDVNGDGVVDQSDLQQVLDNTGPCDGCPEDVNGDGFVNGPDAAAVATHFGPCP